MSHQPTPRLRETPVRSAPLAVMTTLALALSGCVGITGSGSVQTETRGVSGFTTVDLTAVGRVVLAQAESDSLTIEAESNLLAELTSEVSNGVLTLGTRKDRLINPTRDITYRITVKQLAGLRLSGSGSMAATGINTAALLVDLSGSGDITAAGNAQAQTVAISGSGNYHGDGLTTRSASVKISGSGNATVNAIDTLGASISGSGNITYMGSPRITTDTSGSGRVHPA